MGLGTLCGAGALPPPPLPPAPCPLPLTMSCALAAGQVLMGYGRRPNSQLLQVRQTSFWFAQRPSVACWTLCICVCVCVCLVQYGGYVVSDNPWDVVSVVVWFDTTDKLLAVR
jgi:hypothetical protein